MLKLNPDPTFKAEVALSIPGEREPGEISLIFKYRNRDEMKDFYKQPDPKSKKKDRTDIEIFSEMVVGWDGIDAEFTKENIEVFLRNYPCAAMEIALEYPKLLLVSKVKN